MIGPGRERKLLDPPDVDDRRASRPVVAVGGRERALVALVERAAVILAVAIDERVAQLVAPRAGRLDEPPFELGDVVSVRDAVGGVDDVVDAREQRFGELQRPVDVSSR